MRYYSILAVCVLLVGITLALFSNTLGAVFVYDDTYVRWMHAHPGYHGLYS